MEIQKVLVGQDGKVSITCPKCGRSKSGSAFSLINKRKMTIECTCKYIFGIQLEFRRGFRRKTNLNGFVEGISKEERWAKLAWQSRSPDSQSVNCRIRNISQAGIGLMTLRKLHIKEGDWVKIQFRLDDSASSPIVKKAMVKVVKYNYIGCEFFEEDKSDPKIGFYLL